MANHLVSIICPSYNCEKYIVDVINSVINQTYCNWELIIVDDCSVDNTVKVIEPFLTDCRIHLFKNSENSGAAITRNRALREAKGKWIAFLDSDDLWYTSKLEKQINFMKENGYHFSYTGYLEIDEEGNERGVSVSGPKMITKSKMYAYCWLGCLTVMYDSDYIGLIQIENIKKNNDYAIWLKAVRKANCYYLDENLARYRRGRKQSLSNHNILTMMFWHYKLFRYAEKMKIIDSLCHTYINLLCGLYKKLRYVKKYKVWG